MADPVGTREIADRLGAARQTVWTWIDQGIFPDPDWASVNARPAWEWERVLRWAGDGQRLHQAPVRAEYRKRFGVEPPAFRPAGPITDQVAKVNAETKAAKAKAAKAKGRRKPRATATA
jgi:predicted DNA-binding transcriptional regulator AlpA